MSRATVSPFIDSYHPQKDGKCKVSIRVTFQRKKKYYPTNMSMKDADFKRIMASKRRKESDNAIYMQIHAFEKKAYEVIQSLPVFTFGMFEAMYLDNREAADSIASGFNKYIAELREERRIGTAVSYECAKASIEAFKKGLKFADITPTLLRKYEESMISSGKSRTTVGIYLRSLRAIFNRASVDKALYPFGEGKGKYSIPVGKNIKKALSISEIAEIFKFKARNDSEAMAKDYWIFIYLCNGLNVKDLCLLKRNNISGSILTYERAKTKRSKKENDMITVSLKKEAKDIIAKWGQPSINPESYLFPHIKKNMTADQERRVIQQLTKLVNKYMKRIAIELGIQKEVTSYFARHSFATVLRNSGASMEFISEALGHSDMKTTKSYLAGFEEETIHKTTDALTAFS